VERAGVEGTEIGEVILGNVLAAGLGLNASRVAYLEAGIPKEVPGYGINKACGSGLKAVANAASGVLLGEYDVAVAGGFESMSNAPYLLQKARYGYRLGHGELLDSMISDGLSCPITHVHMGVTAENIAKKYEIPRAEQDEFAAASQAKAVAAQAAGKFRAEIVPVDVAGKKKGETVQFAVDEFPRADTTAEKLGGLRAAFQNWMEPQISDRPDLREAVIPNSPVGAKRILRDNGSWIRTLKRANVETVRTRIEKIAPDGVVTADGRLHPLDVLIYGTGFQASNFLAPIEIVGRDDRNLHRCWNENPRAYIGGTVPGFPNMFMIYGPNTNLVVHGGSVILFSELSAKYILNAVLALLEAGKRSLDVTEEAFETYNDRVDETNARRAWGYSSVNSWYKNKKGRVTQNYPFTISEYWQRTNRFDKDDYRFR